MAKQEKYAKLCKEKMVDEIIARINEKPNFVITSYMGSSVADLESLRKGLKKNSSDYLVVKNSILKVVFDKLQLSAEVSKIDKGMGLSFSGDDIVATCKTLASFSGTHDKFQIKGAIVEGKSISAENVKVLATLPSKEVLLSMVFAGMKAPISSFVNVLGGVVRKFVYVVDAVKVAKQNSAVVPNPANEVKA